MIKQTRDVPNLSWLDLLGAAQNEVVILRSLEAGAKSGTLDQLRFENPEVREKILGQEKRPIPVGFEVGIAAAPGGVELVLVAVDQPRVRMRVDFTGDKVKRGGREHVVVVEQRDEIAGR